MKITQSEFLAEIAEILQMDEVPSPDYNLENSQYWDSTAQMAIMAFFCRKFGENISLEDITMTTHVSDLIGIVKKYLCD